mgnify:CR=1 FL=1
MFKLFQPQHTINKLGSKHILQCEHIKCSILHHIICTKIVCVQTDDCEWNQK